MDLILGTADKWLLDGLYASLVPVSAFVHSTAAGNSSSQFLRPTLSTASKWTNVVSYLPHPPLAPLLEEVAAVAEQPMFSSSAWPRDYLPRQLLSLSVLTLLGISILYFLFAGLAYQFIFDHRMMKHPRFLKNQVKLEIQSSIRAFPGMTLLTIPWFLAEVKGYSKMYSDVSERGWLYLLATVPLYLLFTDYCIYWVHRALHHPLLYKTIHKPHHKWIIPTPFASHAFHAVDGYLQSVPYHMFIFIVPMHRILYLVLFVLVNFWAIFIHDSDMITGHPLEKIINGPAHHTLHHLYFTVNYGQYFTWADRVGGSYRQPMSSLDPMHEVTAAEEKAAAAAVALKQAKVDVGKQM